MATNKSVTVLAPNGRHQNVKITPNTTILQVLEEVCQKQGYSSKKYDLKHFNKILDVTSIIRFTGLANNAQLEMTPRSTERQVSSIVTIGIQLENGQRLTGDFVPTTNLLEIITALCPGEISDDTVLIYMHQELHGNENLETTTLQSLGLTSGRGMVRLIHRNIEKLNTQAHAGQVHLKQTSSGNTQQTNQSKIRDASSSISSSAAAITSQIKKAFDPIAKFRAEKNNSNNNKKNNSGKKFSGGGHVLGGSSGGDQSDSKSRLVTEATKTQPQQQKKLSVASKNQCMDSEIEMKDGKSITSMDLNASDEINNEINFLDERHTIIFSQSDAQAIPHEDLPDNFFDLTVDDAKALVRDAKRQREQLEEEPLITNAQRELNRHQSKLNKLHKYLKTILRIQFPNQMILQGIFGPLETVQAVKEFVKKYLNNPEQDFTLYCSPPRKNLLPQLRLIDENLVPSAIIYYSGTSDLKPDLQSKLVDPKQASIQAIKSRINLTRNSDQLHENSPMDDLKANKNNELFDESSPQPTTSRGIDETLSNTTDRIKSLTPKWFKNAFK